LDWRNGASVSSLSQILETGPIPRRFYLSSLACRGILRRAEKRGKTLPPSLQAALEATASPELVVLCAPQAEITGGGSENLVATFDRQSNCEYGSADLAITVRAGDYKSPTDLVATCITGEITHALKAEGADASEDGTGRGNPIVAKTVALRGRDGGATAELGGEVATALRASGGGGDKAHVMVNYAEELYGTLSASEGGTLTQVLPVVTQSAVRRLTPVECERLQGFPENYTNIPWRGKPHSPDGPRYKALGNSWAVPKFTWIGERIARFMPPVSVPVAANNNEAINEAA